MATAMKCNVACHTRYACAPHNKSGSSQRRKQGKQSDKQLCNAKKICCTTKTKAINERYQSKGFANKSISIHLERKCRQHSVESSCVYLFLCKLATKSRQSRQSVHKMQRDHIISAASWKSVKAAEAFYFVCCCCCCVSV